MGHVPERIGVLKSPRSGSSHGSGVVLLSTTSDLRSDGSCGRAASPPPAAARDERLVGRLTTVHGERARTSLLSPVSTWTEHDDLLCGMDELVTLVDDVCVTVTRQIEDLIGALIAVRRARAAAPGN